MIAEIVKEIRDGVPAYDRPQDDKAMVLLVSSVEHALRRLADGIGKPQTDRTTGDDWFRRLGRMEFFAGRSMDSVQTAIRIGTRVAWRHLWAAGASAGVPSSTFNTLADALFHYADELSLAAIAGHADAQARVNGTMERRRQRLLRMIISDPPISPLAIEELADDVGWKMPGRVAVVVLEQRAGQRLPQARSISPDVLSDLDGDEPCLVTAEPDRELADLRRELRGRVAAVGPLVPVAQAAQSFDCARRALELALRGVLPADGVIHCSDHLPTLAIYANEFILGQLTERAFRPFADLTSKQRDRLSETLRAWLGARGGINEVAAHLEVHPQTVRYRMNQISDLLDGRLDDPDERFLLDMALRAVPPDSDAPDTATWE